MHFEIRFSTDRFPPTTTPASTGPPAYAPTNNYFQCFVALAVVALLTYLHLIWLGIQRLAPNAPGEAPPATTTPSLVTSRGLKAAACQCCPPVQVVQETAAGDEDAASQRQIKDRVPIVQALLPSGHTEAREPDHQPSSSAPVIRRNTRGSSPLVVRPRDPASLPSGASSQYGVIPEKPVYPHSNICPTAEVSSVPAQTNSGPASHDNDQPQSPARTDISAAQNSPLKRTLVGCDIPIGTTTFTALGVGVGDEDSPGPHHDIDLLSAALPKDKFCSLKGPDATREIIRQKIREIFKRAQLLTCVVLYFTGHGNDRNAFRLHGNEFIDVDTLLDWIHQARENTGKYLPVFLVFDHCRESDDLPLMSIEKLEKVYVIWACSPRQRAYEVRLDDSLPYSEFLKAVCLTLRELLVDPPQSPTFFLQRVIHWMSLAVRVHRGFICERVKCPIPWLACRCVTCYAGGLCEHPAHRLRDMWPIQTPTGWFWMSKCDIEMNRAIPVIRSIAEPIRRVGDNILSNPQYRKHATERPSSSSADHSQHVKFSTRPRVAAAPTPALPGTSSDRLRPSVQRT